ncbi:MAG: hypothetical protein J6C28_01025 [Bacilli bacterium]|nr:hypothetical protein [Bacilli bacterium]
MTQTTILDKLKVILDVSMSSKLFIAVILFIILITLVSLTTNRKNVRRTKIIYGLTYLIIIAAIIVFYYDSLGKMFDYMMNNFFIVLYFPNVAVYLAAIIVTNIIVLVSVFNFKTPKLVRNINVIIYGIINYLLALVLNVVTKNNLDIFSQTSVYGNANAQAIIEVSSTIFMIWLAFLVIYKMIRMYQKKDEPVKRKVIVKKVRKLPEGIVEVPVPLFVKGQPKKVEEAKTKEDPVIVATFTDDLKLEKEALEKQLEEAEKKLKQAEEQIKVHETTIKIKTDEVEEKLRLAEEQIKVHEETIKNKEQENSKLEQEQIALQYEQVQLQQEKAKLQQEKTKLLQENQKLQDAKVEVLEVKEETKVDATAAIMKNLDNMFTLEDYKILATILKDRQKKKNEQKLKEEIRKQEQLKFAQIHEAYRSTR